MKYEKDDRSWSKDEDILLLRGFGVHGEKWSLISMFFLPQRNRKEIRNRFLPASAVIIISYLQRRWNQLTKEAAKEAREGADAPLPPPRLSNGSIQPSVAEFLRRIRGAGNASKKMDKSAVIDFESDYVHSSDDDADEELSVLPESSSMGLRDFPLRVESTEGSCLLNRVGLTPNVNVVGHKPVVFHNRSGTHLQLPSKVQGSDSVESIRPSRAKDLAGPTVDGNSSFGFTNISSLINGTLQVLEADAPRMECNRSTDSTARLSELSKRKAEEPKAQMQKRHTSLFSMVTQNRPAGG